MIILKNEVFESKIFMETIRNINESSELSAKVAYWFNRIVKELQNRMVDYNETRIKLIEKYGKLEKEHERYVIEEVNVEKWKNEFQDLLQQEFTLPFSKQKFPDTIKISPLSINMLESIFDFSDIITE